MQPFFQWKSKEYYIFRECVFSLRYPASNAREPYCHLWHASLYNIFPHYLINNTIYETKVIGGKMCFDILYNIRLKHLIRRRTGRDMIKNA